MFGEYNGTIGDYRNGQAVIPNVTMSNDHTANETSEATLPAWTKETDELYSKLRDDLYDLWFCGCGAVGCAIRMLRDALRAIENRHLSYELEPQPKGHFASGGRWIHPPDPPLYAAAREALRVAIGREDTETEAHFWNFLYILDHFELTEHGTSCRASWLTDKGRDLLLRLESVDIDDLAHGPFAENPQ